MMFVSDQHNNRICTMTREGAVSTLCGGRHRTGGFADGRNSQAELNGPAGLAVDMDGSLLVADYGNDAIRRVYPSGSVATVAGSRSEDAARAEFADGVGTAASFQGPSSVAVAVLRHDQNASIIVTDSLNNRIRIISPGPDAQVSTLAGGPQQGHQDGEGLSALFDQPWALLVDDGGRLAVADW